MDDLLVRCSYYILGFPAKNFLSILLAPATPHGADNINFRGCEILVPEVLYVSKLQISKYQTVNFVFDRFFRSLDSSNSLGFAPCATSRW